MNTLFGGRQPFDNGYFTLGAPVRPDQPNRREDVIKVETLLGNTGHLDLTKTDGPLGLWGGRPEEAVRDYQEGKLANVPAFGGLGKIVGRFNVAGQVIGALGGSRGAMEYLTSVLYPKRGELEQKRHGLQEAQKDAEQVVEDAQAVLDEAIQAYEECYADEEDEPPPEEERPPAERG